MLTIIATPAPRLCGWFNPFIQNRTLKEVQRLTVATGIDHTPAWERAADIKRGGHARTTTPDKKAR